MKDKTMKILAYFLVLAGLILFVTVKFIFPPCSGMVATAAGKEVPMRCHYAAIWIEYLAILFAVVNIISILKQEYLQGGIIDIVLIIFIFMSTNSKLGMGMCADLTMPCHSMNTAARFISIVSGIAALILILKSKNE